MICKEYQNQIVLFLYEELEDGDRSALEIHIRECDGCRRTFEDQKSFHLVISEDNSSWNFPSDLLVESRQALTNELDRIERKRSWWRVPTFSVVFTPMRLLESATLIAMGLALGVYISRHQLDVPTPTPLAEAAEPVLSVPTGGTVSNLRIISTDADSGVVEMAGDVVQPLKFHGRMNDETTLRLLFSALQDSGNPASRLEAADVLSRRSDDAAVKQVLIGALLNDENLGVRLKALDGLKPFAGEQDVRSAFMQALAHDPDSGIRIGAIETLVPYTENQAEVSRIQEVTKDDDNPYVRLKAQGLQFVGNHP